MMEENIRCPYCGFPFHGQEITINYYGRQRYWIMCEQCGRTLRLEMDIIRLLPDYWELNKLQDDERRD